MANNISAAGGCCFDSPCPAVNPLEAENIVLAGGVTGSGCAAADTGSGCALAAAYFPFQEYRAGFCPAEALKRGTLFPELVSEYAGGGC